MKDARYLIRISNTGEHTSVDHADLLAKARMVAGLINGKAINLRVSPQAIEFDLFCSPETDPTVIKIALEPLGKVITCKRLDVPPIKIETQKVVDEARQLFNEHRFWEVHEVLEGLWKELQGPEKNLVQGLILAAASLVHAQKDEEAVMWTMLADAMKRLENQPDHYYGWDIGKYRNHFAQSLAAKKLEIPTV